MNELEKQAMQMFPPLMEYLPKRGETYDINESHRTAFIMGANWQKEQLIKKASKWIADRVSVPVDVETDNDGYILAESFIKVTKTRLEVTNEVIKEFENYMKECN